MLCEDLPDEAEGTAIAHRVRQAVEDSAHEPPCRVTVGVAIAHDRHLDPDGLVAEADGGLAAAKQAMESMGGTLRHVPVVPHGARLVLTLPSRQRAAASAGQPA